MCYLVPEDVRRLLASANLHRTLCRYKLPKVGKMAINDGLILEACIYLMLKKHCKTHPAYLDLIEIFHEVHVNSTSHAVRARPKTYEQWRGILRVVCACMLVFAYGVMCRLDMGVV